MRTLFFSLFAFIALSLLAQQSYRVSGIIAHSGGAYKPAIKDLDDVLEEVKKSTKRKRAGACKAHSLAGVSYFLKVEEKLQDEEQKAYLKSLTGSNQ